MDKLSFSLLEMLSLFGVAQCLYIIVYLLFRSGNLASAMLPLLYFFVLGSAFFINFSERFLGEFFLYYSHLQWALWFYGPPLSVLLIVQIAQIQKLPNFRDYLILALIPIAYILSVVFAKRDLNCLFPQDCSVLSDWLTVSGLIAGLISVLVVWLRRGFLSGLIQQKQGRERYWLVISIALLNLGFLALMLSSLSPYSGHIEISVLRTILGLAFIYLVNTSLFRIYPQAVSLTKSISSEAPLSQEESEIALKIEKLMDLDKVYHENTYSRADLARELKTSESVISKIINMYFNKSFPQLLNERRVEDAKRLLLDTPESIKVIASEVGFNSVASFNRSFKEISGMSPSAYRKKQKIKAS